MATRASRRAERLQREVDAVLPPPPSPEDIEREEREFLEGWAREVVAAAHEARARRERGEERDQPIAGAPGLEVMGVCVSYGGAEPPEDARLALLSLLAPDEWPEIGDRERVEGLNAAPREALALAFALYAEQTAG